MTRLMCVAFFITYMRRLKQPCGQKEPIEALFRSIFLVLMDNATAEYSFVTKFFASEPSTLLPSSKQSNDILFPATPAGTGGFDEGHLAIGSEIGGQTPRLRTDSTNPTSATPKQNAFAKMERAPLDAIWKQIMDPILEYCQVMVARITPPVLLTCV